MEFAHAYTMGYCIDDIKDDKLLQDIVIATYNKVTVNTKFYCMQDLMD